MGNHAIRLGKTMPYTSLDGVEHANSFWVLDRLAVDIPDQAIRLKFVGYHSTAAYDADRQPVAGAMKEYIVSGAGFVAAISMLTSAANVAISAEIIRLAWTVALAELDVDDPDHPGEQISFFNGAVDIV